MTFNKWLFRGAWIVSGCIILLGSGLAILYGNSYGYIKSVLWLLSFLISFLTSTFLVQPAKLCVVSVVFGYFGAKQPLTDPIASPDVVKSTSEGYIREYQEIFRNYKQSCEISKIDPKAVDAREHEKTCIYYRELMSDLFMFSVYLTILLLIVLGTRDRMVFYSDSLARDYLVNGKYVTSPGTEVQDEQGLITYLQNVLVPTLHSGETMLNPYLNLFKKFIGFIGR